MVLKDYQCDIKHSFYTKTQQTIKVGDQLGSVNATILVFAEYAWYISHNYTNQRVNSHSSGRTKPSQDWAFADIQFGMQFFFFFFL